jgi:biopolymer transport protein ExbB/TolQ
MMIAITIVLSILTLILMIVGFALAYMRANKIEKRLYDLSKLPNGTDILQKLDVLTDRATDSLSSGNIMTSIENGTDKILKKLDTIELGGVTLSSKVDKLNDTVTSSLKNNDGIAKADKVAEIKAQLDRLMDPKAIADNLRDVLGKNK